ncbi:beta-eliminating lyase-related protein [Massilia sp. B-10]|nr:beta-eliminating lyase-related protein [Massilia sp. B-10]
MTDAELLQQCHTVIPGHRARTLTEMFGAMAAWCEANGVSHDVYGDGALIQAFEDKVARLLGMEAAVFCISGTMAQVTALRLGCEERDSRLAALHPTSHIIVHEKSNYQLFGHFNMVQAGDRHRPATAADFEAIPDRLGAVAIELPMREIGGQLPDWDALQAIKLHCRLRNAHLHMDGARLWEAACLLWPQRGRNRGYFSIRCTCRSTKALAAWVAPCWLSSREFVARGRIVPPPGRQRDPPLTLRGGGGHAVRPAPGRDASPVPPHPVAVWRAARLPCPARQPRPAAGQHAAPAFAGRARARWRFAISWPKSTRSGCSGAHRMRPCPTAASSSCTWATIWPRSMTTRS